MKVLLSILLLTVLQFLMTEGEDVSEMAIDEAGDCPPGFLAGVNGECMEDESVPYFRQKCGKYEKMVTHRLGSRHCHFDWNKYLSRG
ncbi:UNVERIFIED_CONTAM: hypothetical protein PYX00_004600 [Menopon gallinae]|uniref:Uncharacterized protein n=1 Tax=Menopon gallinae TaxID=328185 RepID=A0AAW2I5Q1_9NEOP